MTDTAPASSDATGAGVAGKADISGTYISNQILEVLVGAQGLEPWTR